VTQSLECPTWLSVDEQRMWWELAPHVAEHAGLTPRNAERLAAVVHAHAELIALGEFLDAHGYTRQTRKGPVTRPEWRRYAKASRTLRYHSSALGLTPVGRARLARAKRRHLPPSPRA